MGDVPEDMHMSHDNARYTRLGYVKQDFEYLN